MSDALCTEMRVAAYLSGVEQELVAAGVRDRAEILEGINEHIQVELSKSEQHDVGEILSGMGSPRAIAAAAVSDEPRRPKKPGTEWLVLLLLSLGGFALGIGWCVGVALLWASRSWTRRQKLIGTFVVPGGLAAAWLWLVLTTTPSGCQIATRGTRVISSSCLSSVPTALRIALGVAFVVVEVASIAYLYRAAQGHSHYRGALVRRWHIVAGVLVLAIALLVFTLVMSPSSTTADTHSESVTSFDDVKIMTICDRSNPNESMGMSKPTLVDRIDGVDAVIFATSTRYSACIVLGAKGTDESEPTAIRHITRGVGQLESFGTLNKAAGRSLWTTDTWFVVKTSPTVSTIKSVTRGFSHVSKIRGGFAFIHEKETAYLHGKFSYGIAAGFNQGGGVVGSTPLT
jgi:uncharacterized membrane protein